MDFIGGMILGGVIAFLEKRVLECFGIKEEYK